VSEALAPLRLRPGPRPEETSAAVFLDRDGVLAETRFDDAGRPDTLRGADDLVVPEDVAPALDELREAGYLLIVVTNQPDVARGTAALAEVVAVDEALIARLPLADTYICPHASRDGCECRKPLPGSLLAAARDWNIDLTQSWMIGDRWVDVAAGNAAGVKTVLLDRPYSWAPTSAGGPHAGLAPTHQGTTMTQCVRLVLA
jgi:D-glycero-D-manno-heptose 1,7-bisphosphate phosphatase